MPSITRAQYDKWNAQARNGFRFDLEKYVTWGEKELEKEIENGDGTRTRYQIQFTPEFERVNNGYCSWNRQTGRVIPELTISKMTPTGTAGCWNVGRPDRYEIGAAQDKKLYSTLCKLSETLNLDEYKKPTATGAYSLF